MDSQSPPKGSLEELFRHHLLESEAAAVPPRPLVWEHLDNSLLVAENEKYRRRLLVHRWGIAASLLLAALAGGGWWHSQQPAAPNLTTITGSAARVAGATMAARRPQGTVAVARPLGSVTGATTQPTAAAAQAEHAAWLASTSPGHQAAGTSAHLVVMSGRGAASARATRVPAYSLGRSSGPMLPAYAYRPAGAARGQTGPADALGAATTVSYSTAQPIGSTTTSFAGFSVAAQNGLARTTAPYTMAEDAPAAASRAGEDLLARTPAHLAPGPDLGLPASLTPLETNMLPATKLRRWRFGAEYAATAFNPNADFAGGNSTSAYPQNSITIPSFASVGQSAAAEYRSNLRAGLGQRLSLRATRWLGGHWSLSTGLEAAQQEASSATSMGYDGVHLDAASAYSAAPRELRPSSYRYRSAGVPVELRYDNPIKSGVSFYGRLGAIVSALLNVRTEIANNPETARTYTPFAGGTPYRRLTALLRGGAGVRYRPAHRGWGVSVGPTAEAGVQSINSDTDKNFLQQNRPYSFGLEAGFEFGSGTVPVQ